VSREAKSTTPGGGEASKGRKRKSDLHQEFFPDSCFLKGVERYLRLSFSLPRVLGMESALGLGLVDRDTQSLELQVQ